MDGACCGSGRLASLAGRIHYSCAAAKLRALCRCQRLNVNRAPKGELGGPDSRVDCTCQTGTSDGRCADAELTRLPSRAYPAAAAAYRHSSGDTEGSATPASLFTVTSRTSALSWRTFADRSTSGRAKHTLISGLRQAPTAGATLAGAPNTRRRLSMPTGQPASESRSHRSTSRATTEVVPRWSPTRADFCG